MTLKKNIRLHGKRCKCGQEEKAVIFVGCTQNGKSSLIRAICDYGGYGVEAKEIGVGLGVISTTKDVSEFKVTIDIKDHYLKDAEGRIIDVDENTELYECEPDSSPSGKHIHLRMLDTPGLDDSSNERDDVNERQEKGVDIDSQMRSVDEKHKLAVLHALASLEKVHSVCFVLSLQNTIGKATQDIIRQYSSIFEKSQLDASFHFAHTYVTVENMFDKKVITRPSIIEETFNVKAKRLEHHFIDNLPLEDDPISKHFADWAIADLLSSLIDETGQATTGIRYPKESPVYNKMDGDLKETLRILEHSRQIELSDQQTKSSRLQNSIKPLKAKEDVQRQEWTKLLDEYKDLDTYDLVQIGFEHKSEPAHFFSCSKVKFNISAKAPIRDWETSSKFPDSNWFGPDQSTKGTKSCEAALESNGWGGAVEGSVKLLGWKKEANSSTLVRLKKEEEDAYSEYQSTKSRIEQLEQQIQESESEAAALEAFIKSLEVDLKILRMEYIDMPRLKTHAPYFGSPNIICYAHGLGLQRPIEMLLLPDELFPTPKLSMLLTQKKFSFHNLVSITRATLRAISIDLCHKRKFRTQLLAMTNTTRDLVGSVNEKTTGHRLWTQPDHYIETLNAEERAEFAPHFDLLCAELRTRTATSDDAMLATFDEEIAHLQGRIAVLERATIQIDESVKQSCQAEKMWEDKLADAEASLTVVKAAQNLLDGIGEMSLGVFSLLRRAYIECEDWAEAWERLLLGLKEAYLCNKENFNEVFLLYE